MPYRTFRSSNVSGKAAHISRVSHEGQADQVQALGFTGRGVTVAVLDSGIDTDRPDLRDGILAEHCFCANEGSGHIRAI